MAAVMAITSERRSPTFTRASEKTSVHPRPPEDRVSPVVGSILPTAWNWSASSSRAGLVAATLLGDRVHDDRRTVGLRELQRLQQRRQIVTVDRAEVLDVEVGVQRLVVREPREEAVRAAAHTAEHCASHRPERTEEAIGLVVEVLVGRGGADPVEEARHAADGRRVRAAVVVHDDDEVAVVVVGDVVQRLPCHTAGQRAVADDRDDVSVRAAGGGECPRHAVGPAQELEA